ncbi:50S ribosomal protein L4 [candidate division MSBL1 archaeon SCGC-AAA261D19]|uniref:Large ribosomal subunit protein uL4 n=1 Tax=candidate division MSBL1 archaeon SCGC-AAA261D19 TaxID=1698273 RepID=A0A133V7X0_9EURY|nr:50S ribosomal protein L4 [candidate division MSBL1 archaeon SCGC-AAA261D19]
MKANVYSLDGEKGSEVELPSIFEEKYRPDVIRRAVLSAQSARIQPWGSDPQAGKRTTAETWGKGSGVARVRRIKGRRYRAAGRGAFAPFTTGGRRAHPPKAEQDRTEKINKKERHLAIRSAIAATIDKNLVTSRGHVLDEVEEFPIVVEDELEEIKKAQEVEEFLKKIGFEGDLKRAKEGRKIRAGKGKMRGRRYRQPVGPLLIVGEDHGIIRAAQNIPSVEATTVEKVNAESLAPGGDPARLTIWTRSAIEKLAGGLFS